MPRRACKPESRRLVFARGVAEKIGCYVYVLLDPRCDPPQPFYVGKGMGNRAYDHANAAISTKDEGDKLALIRRIHHSGHEVLVEIVRHGLDERTAFIVEAAVMDAVARYVNRGVRRLTNEVLGHGHEFGLVTLDELFERYAAPPLELGDEKVVLIRIARKWDRMMSERALYEATRKHWKVDPRRARSARYALAIGGGIVRAVYEGCTWRKSQATRGRDLGRWMFTATPSQEKRSWSGCNATRYLSEGSQNPIRYVNC